MKVIDYINQCKETYEVCDNCVISYCCWIVRTPGHADVGVDPEWDAQVAEWLEKDIKEF